MNKNKKLSNQSLDPTSMVVDVYPLFIGGIGFDFQSTNHEMSKKVKKALEKNGVLPKYFEYLAIATILPKLELCNLGSGYIINLGIGTNNLQLLCVSTKRLNGELIAKKHTIVWMTLDEYFKLVEMSPNEFHDYIKNNFESLVEIF